MDFWRGFWQRVYWWISGRFLEGILEGVLDGVSRCGSKIVSKGGREGFLEVQEPLVEHLVQIPLETSRGTLQNPLQKFPPNSLKDTSGNTSRTPF